MSIKKNNGFTLIELLIVIAIVGIIASVALPSYREATLRSGRSDGKSALINVASMQERFYSAQNTYSTNANPLSNPVAVTVDSSDGKYSIAVASCGAGTIATCFVATATPQGGQTDDSCGNLTLSSTGVKAASGGTQAECWSR